MSHIKKVIEFNRTAHGRYTAGYERSVRLKLEPKPKPPHITRLLALAIRLEHLLATGVLKDQADIARTASISRARVTQILNLTNLAPDIQEEIIDLEPTTKTRHRLQEEAVRKIATDPNWSKQRKAWKNLKRMSEPS